MRESNFNMPRLQCRACGKCHHFDDLRSASRVSLKKQVAQLEADGKDNDDILVAVCARSVMCKACASAQVAARRRKVRAEHPELDKTDREECKRDFPELYAAGCWTREARHRIRHRLTLDGMTEGEREALIDPEMGADVVVDWIISHGDDPACAMCRRSVRFDVPSKHEERAYLDHKHPLCLAGRHSLENTQLLCYGCHLDKTREDIDMLVAHRKAVADAN